MKRNLLFCLCLCVLLLSSCATIFNAPHTKIRIYTDEPVTVTTEEGSLTTEKNKTVLFLKRTNKAIPVSIGEDSLILYPKLSTAFWLNVSNALSGWGLVGLVVDLTNDKRFTYDRIIYRSMVDSIPRFLNYRPQNEVGEMTFHFSVPFPAYNQLYLHPSDIIHPREYSGIFGFKIGLDYYHAPKQYFNLSGNVATSEFVLFPRLGQRNGKYEVASSSRIHFTNNHKINRFSLGYGIHLANNRWALEYEERVRPPNFENINNRTNNLGLTFSTHYQPSPFFYIGVLYQPNFLRLNSGQRNVYEHVIGVDLMWKIK